MVSFAIGADKAAFPSGIAPANSSRPRSPSAPSAVLDDRPRHRRLSARRTSMCPEREQDRKVPWLACGEELVHWALAAALLCRLGSGTRALAARSPEGTGRDA